MLHNRAGWETPTRWGRRHPGGGVGDPHGLRDPHRLGDALGWVEDAHWAGWETPIGWGRRRPCAGWKTPVGWEMPKDSETAT